MEAQIELFNKHLPDKVWCADDFEEGLKVRKKIDALARRYIGLNKPYREYISIDLIF